MKTLCSVFQREKSTVSQWLALYAITGLAVAAPVAKAQVSGTELRPAVAAEPAAYLAQNDPGESPLADAKGSDAGSSSSLPEAPEPQVHKLDTPPATPAQAEHIAPKYSTTISAGYRAQPLDARDKVVFGLRDSYSFTSLAAIALSAGYSHVTDGQPNFGVNSKAFAQRLGSSAVRETSQNIFSESIMAPLLHEDPRYYVKGPGTSFVNRTLYAITRPLITRTDAGNRTINGALLIGYAGSAALTPTFYPQINRNFHDVASTYGASVGGSALGYFVSEFSDDVLTILHLKRFE